jgi:DNA-binding transcriptional LysR family regulator
MVPVCKSSLLDGKSAVEPSELEKMPLLHQSARPDAWREWFEIAGMPNVNAMGGSRYEIFAMLVEAAKAGLGVALMPKFFVLDEIASGELVVPCPYVLHNQRSYYLVYPEDKQGSESLQVFCGWLRVQAKTYLEVGDKRGDEQEMNEAAK